MDRLDVHSEAERAAVHAAGRRECPPAFPPGRKIKAVHLLHSIAYGGVETILLNWFRKVRASPDSRIELSLVCFQNPGGTEQAFVNAARKQGLTVRTIPWSRRKPFFSSGLKLARILRAEHADVVHTHNTYADLTGLVAARLTGVKTVSSVYVWSDFGWKRNALQWINERALRWFDAVAAQCHSTLRDTCARGIDPRKVRILPSGFELNRDHLQERERARRRAARGAGANDVVLINVARLYPEKAQDKLLRIFKGLLSGHPGLKLWILGVGPLEQSLRATARELQLEDQVAFLGFSEDLASVLKLADIQVHPSFAEGVPMSLLSGMACALPVIASGVGGIPEVLQDGVSGILVPAANDPEFEGRFSRAVLKLVEDPGLRRGLGTQAATFIETEYSMEAAIRKLERLYADVLAS
jgi:glycosyltransferase involved in cell wall biosynthesis